MHSDTEEEARLYGRGWTFPPTFALATGSGANAGGGDECRRDERGTEFEGVVLHPAR